MEIEKDGFRVEIEEKDIRYLEANFETTAIKVYLPKGVDTTTKKAILFHEIVEAVTYSHFFALAAEFLLGWPIKMRLKYDPLFWVLIALYSVGGYFLVTGNFADASAFLFMPSLILALLILVPMILHFKDLTAVEFAKQIVEEFEKRMKED